MTDSAQILRRECATFTQLLAGRRPSDYVIEKYVDAHERHTAFGTGDRFDKWLTRVAGTHPVVARLADAYAVLLARRSQLRCKLVLLLAILETTAPFDAILESHARTSATRVVLAGLWRVGTALFITTASLVSFGLARILLATVSRKR